MPSRTNAVNLAFLNEVGVYAELQLPTMRALGVDSAEHIQDPNIVVIDNFYIFESLDLGQDGQEIPIIGVLILTSTQLLVVSALKGELDPTKAAFQIGASPLSQIIQIDELMTPQRHRLSIEMSNGAQTSISRAQSLGETTTTISPRIMFFETTIPAQSRKLAQTAKALRLAQGRR